MMNLSFIVNERVMGIRAAMELWKSIESSIYQKRLLFQDEARIILGYLSRGESLGAEGWLRRN